MNLKPCPFCGSDAELVYKQCDPAIKGFSVFGACTECRCESDSIWVAEEPEPDFACWQDAAEIWNDRPIEDGLKEDIGDLNRENIGLKSILKTLENIEEHKIRGHECYAKHVLLSLRDRLKKIERGKK